MIEGGDDFEESGDIDEENEPNFNRADDAPVPAGAAQERRRSRRRQSSPSQTRTWWSRRRSGRWWWSPVTAKGKGYAESA